MPATHALIGSLYTAEVCTHTNALFMLRQRYNDVYTLNSQFTYSNAYISSAYSLNIETHELPQLVYGTQLSYTQNNDKRMCCVPLSEHLGIIFGCDNSMARQYGCTHASNLDSFTQDCSVLSSVTLLRYSTVLL